MENPKIIPVLPIRNTVFFPEVTSSFMVRRAGSVAALERSGEAGELLVTIAQKNEGIESPNASDLFKVGTLVRVERATPQGSGGDRGYQVGVRGVARFRVDAIRKEESLLFAEGEIVPDQAEEEAATIAALFKSLKTLSGQVLELLPGDTRAMIELLNRVDEPGRLSSLVAHHLDLAVTLKQSLLEERSLKRRMLFLLDHLQKQRDLLQLQRDLSAKMSQNIGKSQREALLREQLQLIRKELGDEGSSAEDGGGFRQKLEEAQLPEEAFQAATSELKRLEALGPASPDAHVIRTYLDWLVSLPWKKSSGADLGALDLQRAEDVLNEDHYGLERIKKRILQHLAVTKLKKTGQGTILLFVGPPGVGKTSLGQSIALALGRKFVRASLGGMRDDAEIRGHRRTYVGALPGRIIQSLKRAGERDPVFMLDEIDKLSHGFYGDPAGAMLEVLDPEQNKNFQDHYLDVPFDLSQVFFVATANSLETIPAPLLDRMEVIELSGYTHAEKFHIARRHLVPKQIEAAGLGPSQLVIPDEVMMKVITGYTRESGVRDLQRKIGAICRVAAQRVLAGTSTPSADVFRVQAELSWLEEAIGSERPRLDELEDAPFAPGVATGLAWTPVGGEILMIEGSKMPGKGGLTLTGQLGDVMKESAQIALSLIRSRLPAFLPGSPDLKWDQYDLHIHVPAGAIPKDGPSAGITMLTALASLVTGRSVKARLAMTGELTLRGAVLPVGGIKEKVIAAHRAGARTVILPTQNQRDLKDVPPEVLSEVGFSFVDEVSQVMELALGLTASEGVRPAQGVQQPRFGNARL